MSLQPTTILPINAEYDRKIKWNTLMNWILCLGPLIATLENDRSTPGHCVVNRLADIDHTTYFHQQTKFYS